MDEINLEQKNAALSAALLSPGSQNMNTVLTQMIHSEPSSPISSITSPVIVLPSHSPAVPLLTTTPADLSPGPAKTQPMTPVSYQTNSLFDVHATTTAPNEASKSNLEEGYETLLITKAANESDIIDVVSDDSISDNIADNNADNKVTPNQSTPKGQILTNGTDKIVDETSENDSTSILDERNTKFLAGAVTNTPETNVTNNSYTPHMRPAINLDLSSLTSPHDDTPVFTIPVTKKETEMSKGGCSVASLLDKNDQSSQSCSPYSQQHAQVPGDFTQLGMDFDNAQLDLRNSQVKGNSSNKPAYILRNPSSNISITQKIDEIISENSQKTKPPELSRKSTRQRRKRESEILQSMQDLQILSQNTPMEISQIAPAGDFTCLGMEFEESGPLSPQKKQKIDSSPNLISHDDIEWSGQDFKFSRFGSSQADMSCSQSDVSSSQLEIPFSQLQNIVSSLTVRDTKDIPNPKKPLSNTPKAVQMRGYRLKQRIQKNIEQRNKTLKDIKRSLNHCKEEIQKCSDKTRQSTMSHTRNTVRDTLLKVLQLMGNVKRDNLRDEAEVLHTKYIPAHYRTCAKEWLTAETTKLTKVYILHRDVLMLLRDLYSSRSRKSNLKTEQKESSVKTEHSTQKNTLVKSERNIQQNTFVKSEETKSRRARRRSRRVEKKDQRQALSVVQGSEIDNKHEIHQEITRRQFSSSKPYTLSKNMPQSTSKLSFNTNTKPAGQNQFISHSQRPFKSSSNVKQEQPSQSSQSSSLQKYRNIAPKQETFVQQSSQRSSQSLPSSCVQKRRKSAPKSPSMFTSPSARQQYTVRESQAIMEEFFRRQKMLIEEGRNAVSLSQQLQQDFANSQAQPYSQTLPSSQALNNSQQLSDSQVSLPQTQSLQSNSSISDILNTVQLIEHNNLSPNIQQKQPTISFQSQHSNQSDSAQHQQNPNKPPPVSRKQTILTRPLPRELTRLIPSPKQSLASRNAPFPILISPSSPSPLSSGSSNETEQNGNEIHETENSYQPYPSPLVKEIKIRNMKKQPQTPEQFRARVEACKALSVLGLMSASPDIRSSLQNLNSEENKTPDATQVHSFNQGPTQDPNNYLTPCHGSTQHGTRHQSSNKSAHDMLCTPLKRDTKIDIPQQEHSNIDEVLKFLIQEEELKVGYNSIYTCSQQGQKIYASVDEEGYILYKDNLFSSCKDWISHVYGSSVLKTTNLCDIVYSNGTRATFWDTMQTHWNTLTSGAATKPNSNNSTLDTYRDRNATTTFAGSVIGKSEFFDICTLLESNFEIRMVCSDEFMSSSDLKLPPNFWYTESVGVPPAIAAEVNVWPDD